MSKLSSFLQGFFWFAFAAFLTASISHIAYFFRAYEPQGDGRDLLWWIVSFAIAVSIDITIFLLSVTVANLHKGKRTGSLIFSVWVFIMGLAVLSFYINYKYAQHFASPSMISPTGVDVPYLGSIGDINPFIASMFQILAIAYTWIADKIVADEKPKTASELKAEADELEQVLAEQKRIKAMKRGMKEENAGGFISTVGNTVKRAKQELESIMNDGKEASKEQAINVPDAQVNDDQNVSIPVSNSEVKTDESEGQNETINVDRNESKTDENVSQTSPFIALTPDVLIVLKAYPKLGSLLSTSRKTATIEEVSEALNVSVKLVSNRVKDHTLKCSPRNDKLILIMSVIAWAKTLYDASQNASKTKEVLALKILSNGHAEEPIEGELIPLNAGEKAS